MANQRRLADNLNRYDVHRQGVPRRAMRCCKVLLFVAAAAADMGLHYSGPHGNYPVYPFGGPRRRY